MEIEIYNLRNSKPIEVYDFYIDRRSPVGNPFELADEKHRDRVCALYDTYFYDQLELGDTEFNRYVAAIDHALKTHGLVRLFCWCEPKRCHGETIKNYLLCWL